MLSKLHLEIIGEQQWEKFSQKSAEVQSEIFLTSVPRCSKEPLPSLSSVRRNEVDDMYVLPALPPAEEKEKSRSESRNVSSNQYSS